jgi:uncharacterized Zn finger protein (UPF0148 family)
MKDERPTCNRCGYVGLKNIHYLGGKTYGPICFKKVLRQREKYEQKEVWW